MDDKIAKPMIVNQIAGVGKFSLENLKSLYLNRSYDAI